MIKAEIEKQKKALGSLVEFRRFFMHEKKDLEPAEIHHRWSDLLLYGKKNIAIEAFRESAKTQIVIRANLLHAVAYPQAHRSYIVIICATQRLASKKLLEVSRAIKADSKSDRALCCLIDTINEDSGLALEIAYTTGITVRIEAYGKGASVRGLSWGSKRPDLVIIDDPQDPEDARSETVTANDWDWFLSDVVFLGQDSRVFLIGNNLGESCIIERVIAHASDLGFDVERVPIVHGAQEVDGKPIVSTGTPVWPAKYTIEGIVSEMEGFSSLGKVDVWWRERMCRTIAPDSQIFKREYFKYFDTKLKTDGMSVYTCVDLASSKKATADQTAVVTVAVSPENHWFILDVDSGRYDPTETMDAIFRAVTKWRPLLVGIESVAYQSVLKHFIEKEMPMRNSFFRIEPLKANNQKELRVGAMQPRFTTGTVWFRALAGWVEDIERELLAFPHGLHDDIIDALAYVDQIAVVPRGTNSKITIPTAGGM